MASISGRISSARLLRSARAHRFAANFDSDHGIELSSKQIKNTDELIDNKNSIQTEEAKECLLILTPEILEKKKELSKLKRKNLEEKNKNEHKKNPVNNSSKLQDGKIIFEDNSNQEEVLENTSRRDPFLLEGNELPNKYGNRSSEFLHKPLVELDPYIALNEETFVIVGKRINKFFIYRFSSSKSFFIFSPFNPIRKAMLFLTTWQIFDWFLILCILANCIIMSIPLTKSQMDIIEYAFTAIYSVEFIVKVIAKGFFVGSCTYLRDPWNWLDFSLIILSYVTIMIAQLSTGGIVSLSSLRGLRVFRAFKTVNIIPGLKRIVSAILKSLIMFSEVLFLMFLVLTMFSLIGLQAFKGVFSQKCVLQYDPNSTNMSFVDWNSNEANWLFDTNLGEYAMCSNGTDLNKGRICDTGYICLRGIGQNPNNGLTHFDNFLFVMIQNFQIMSLDNWEGVLNKIIDTSGLWNVLYALPIVFIGSFYLVNLMLAVVTLAYNIEAENDKKKLEIIPTKKSISNVDIENIKAQLIEKEKRRNEKLNKLKHVDKSIENNEIDKYLFKKAKVYGVQKGTGEILESGNNEKADVSQIKLSEKLNKFDQIVEEGTSSCHYHGNDLVTDKRSFYFCLKFGKCFLKWKKLQDFFYKIVVSGYFQLFIAFCIIINTIIMSMQYYGQPSAIDDLQLYSNYIISSIFILECLMKLIAFGKLFFYDITNWFDLLIVTMSIIDLSSTSINGLSVVRALRLLRIFKLAKTWKAMGRILAIVTKSISSLGYLLLILFIVIYVFALVGYNLFSDYYIQNYSTSEMPRFHFVDITHSLLMIFRILCGECIEPMLECWSVAGPQCVALFYPTVLLGNFLMLNLFMAMLLDAFDSDSLKNDEKEEDDDESDDLTQKINQIKGLFAKFAKWCKSFFVKETSISPKHNQTIENDEKNKDKQPEISNCFPNSFYNKLCHFATLDTRLNKCWFNFRLFFLRVVDHKVFEGFIILCILASSILLAFDDVYLKNESVTREYIQGFDYFFQAVFLVEMFLKWIGYGLKKYFTDWWCLLDFFIVMVSVINLALLLTQSSLQSLSFLKVLRTLRSFRPLRAISKWDGMRIVINALGSSIPPIIDIFVVCIVFWLIFSIVGVSVFSGTFFNCYSTNGSIISYVNNKTECLNLSNTTWFNKKINFDNVGIGYIALLQVATFEGWRELMAAGVDSVGVDMQPKFEANLYAYLFFVVFVFFGSFFTLNLIVGVIIDNFNTLKKKSAHLLFKSNLQQYAQVCLSRENKVSEIKYEGSILEIFVTPAQKKYLKIIKNMSKTKPKKAIKRPENKAQAIIFDIIMSTKFQIATSIMVSLNIITLACEYYNQPAANEEIFNIINTLFVTIFGLEVCFQLFAIRQHYFRSTWNVFNLFVTILCLIGIPMEYEFQKFIVSPLIFYSVRIFRLFRILRFLEATKGVRKLLFALLISLPALLNVATLLFLIIFIYAIIGMNVFMNVKLQNSLTSNNNFQTFGKAFVILFRAGTISGWNDVLDALMIANDDPGSSCDDSFDIQSLPLSYDPSNANGCGYYGFALFYMVSYVMIVRLVMINIYIAVILENYDEVQEQEEIGVTEEDFEYFYSVWEKYDPHATQFIKLAELNDFVGEIGPPLGVKKPNEMAITSFNLPIVCGDLIHCLDVLHALTVYAIDTYEDTDEFKILQGKIDEQFIMHFPVRVNHSPISTTMERKKQEIAARILQRAWKQYKLQKSLRIHAQLHFLSNKPV